MKGTETTIKTKKYFYGLMKKMEGWSIYTLILDKQKLLRKTGKVPTHKNLYNYLARIIIEHVNFNNVSNIVRLFVDRSKNSGEVKEFNEYLANHLATFLPPASKLLIEHQTSAENKGLQTADVFSWGIFRKYEKNDNLWYDLYQYQIIVERLI